MITPLNALELIPDGNDLEAVEVRLLKLDAQKPFGSGTIQSAYAEDSAGNKAGIRFMDYEVLGQDWVGPWARISGTRNGKNELTGLSISSYNGKKRLDVKGLDQHGRSRSVIEWLDAIPAAPAQAAAQPARQGPPAHRNDIEYDQFAQRQQQPVTRPAQGPPPRQSGPPPQAARQAQPPAQQSRPPVPAGPHGATVGMAVKEAFTALVKGVAASTIPDEVRNRTFWQDVHQCASEILHVCKALESGDIAPSVVTTAQANYVAEEAEAAQEPWPE